MKVPFLALILLLPCLGISAAPSADSQKDNSRTEIRVLALNGPSGIGLSRFISEAQTIAGTRVTASVVPSVDVLLPQLLNGDAMAGALPPNVAAKLYNRSSGAVMLCAVIGNGMLSVLSTNPGIKSFEDLADATVYSTGSGSTPEYLFAEIASRIAGGTDGPTLDFSLPPQEIAAALLSGKIEHALLPEPFSTVTLMKSSTARRPVYRSISASEVGRKAGFANDYPMTVFVVRSDFAGRHPELLREILGKVRESILWANDNPAEAGRVAERSGLGLSAAVTEASIPSCNLVYIEARDARDSIERLLTVFLARSPESVGGALPDGKFYLK